MRWLGGRLWHPDGPRQGRVRIDDRARVDAIDTTNPDPVDVPGLVVPAAVNAHTHLADRAARGQAQGLSLEDAVAPPDGLKHRFLREASPQTLTQSIHQSLDEADQAGIRRVIDFREQGPQGARLARNAARGHPVTLTLLGRPTTPQEWNQQRDELARVVDGLGVSGLNDQPLETTKAQADYCHENGLRFALHISEAEREDLDQALALAPDLLVHGTHFTKADAERVAEAGVPVALCPRSNALFNNTPPVETLLEAGVRLGVGTDNAMFHDANVWNEAAYLLDEVQSLDPASVLSMVVAFHLPGEVQPRIRDGERVLVLDDEDGLADAIKNHRMTVPWRENLARYQA